MFAQTLNHGMICKDGRSIARARSVIASLIASLLAACVSAPPSSDTVVLSVIGTNDVHGEFAAQHGGLVALSGYVAALRAQRAQDGAVLLLDGGDMWQGTLESNLNEGAAVVQAYTALAYDAATIGNHEFDFGPVGASAIPEAEGDNPRGVLQTRSAEAGFPLLAANIIDDATGAPVAWTNVQPAVLIERAGIKIGIVGVTTAETLETTIAANTVGLSIAPLAPTIERHAKDLRARGARLVFVVSHAGGHCREAGDPQDLSSCDLDAEIFAVARELPAGLVDHIVAGHHHRPMAHEVNGIAITSNPSSARSFGRVDFEFDRAQGAVLRRTIHPPTTVCLFTHTDSHTCASADEPGAKPVSYAGRVVRPLPAVVAIADGANARAQVVKAEPLGVVLETAVTLEGGPFSALGRLMTDATREATGADVAVHNVVGGLRADLPAGPLTFGDVYRMFPFDNRLSLLQVTVADLTTLLAYQVHHTSLRVTSRRISPASHCTCISTPDTPT
ncbi:MAG: bifunctional UDP-sugar hydrolase/5'-nucleotidase, partial [Pseudomonadota bacterium]